MSGLRGKRQPGGRNVKIPPNHSPAWTTLHTAVLRLGDAIFERRLQVTVGRFGVTRSVLTS